MIRLTIGKLNIQIDGIDRSVVPENTLIFENEFSTSDLYFTFYMDRQPQLPSTPPIYHKEGEITVFRNLSGLESRLMYMPRSRDIYAFIEEKDSVHVEITFNPFYINQLKVNAFFYSVVALEKYLAAKNQFIFHCAYMDLDGEAILITGPSGIGKSTHSNLWKKYMPDRAKILNGDKCLLTREDDGLYACGWPICGTSGICHNEKRKIKAIVMLLQSAENHFPDESRKIQFRRILEQITINYWNRSFADAAINMASEICSNLPCYTYACNISYEAVNILYKKIIETGK